MRINIFSQKGNSVILISISSILIFLLNLSSAYALPGFMQDKTTALIVIFLIILFSNMWVLAEYGVSVSFFFFFGIMFTFGFISAAVIVMLVTFIYTILCVYTTPIDFMITKKVDAALMRGLYFIFAEAALFVVMFLYGGEWVLSNLFFAYMVIYVLYQLVGTTIYLLTGPIGLPQYVVRLAVSISFNWWLITTFGMQYLSYLQGLGT